jgi:uncharacterized protein YnzC (UPF0291/DUF896 family)
MITEEKINRINELAKKSKSVGLTEEEIKERDILRREYIDGFKKNLKGHLETIKVMTPDEYEKHKKENNKK